MKLLIVEDDPKIASFLKQGLEEEFFCVDICDNGEDAIYLASLKQYDAIILDLMLKGLQGEIVCKNIRASKITTPIIVLSAKSAISDKVELLTLGADDYLTKPFSFEELLARINVQKRKKEQCEPLLRIADLELNPLSKTVKRADNFISLTAKEYALLEFFMRHPKRIIEESVLEEQLFSMEQQVQSNIISVYLYRLRIKIDKNHQLKLIKTHRNLGYSISDETL